MTKLQIDHTSGVNLEHPPIGGVKALVDNYVKQKQLSLI